MFRVTVVFFIDLSLQLDYVNFIILSLLLLIDEMPRIKRTKKSLLQNPV